ncbi:MAG: hypothetical protein JRJ23_03250 [Deltaproteobacteria bacterium]|nr:hypothetical protein [Deltaproteobacteria bacterium]MBW1860951.1 hypothetical protein [Deltaproteobacteria bacterium]
MKKRVSKKEWGRIQTVWESGASTPKQISIDFQVNLKTLRNRASLNKWKKCGSVIQTAVKEARKELADETKDSFKKTAQKTNKRHRDIYRNTQELGRIWESLILQEVIYAINEDDVGLEKIQNVIDKIKLRKRTFCASAITNMLKEGINGERKVIGLDEMSFDNQENTLDQLIESLDRARKKKGIKDVPVG